MTDGKMKARIDAALRPMATGVFLTALLLALARYGATEERTLYLVFLLFLVPRTIAMS